MSEPRALPGAAPVSCVFCSRPVAAAERCPLLPSSHWACCSCAAPAAGQQPRPDTGDAA
ncbi:MAG TPA: hypothetical protein VGR68_07535 [Actinomycetota bacterium]|jgi:hypothetical protein|nr:hypothetical protein [Actinomycetota bacterium]